MQDSTRLGGQSEGIAPAQSQSQRQQLSQRQFHSNLKIITITFVNAQ